MSTHELVEQDHSVEPGSDRSFGLIVGGILDAIAIYQYVAHTDLYLWLLVPGTFLICVGLLAPVLLHPLNLAWTHLGVALGRIVTPVIMLVVYVVTIVPIALLLRGSGKNLLRLKAEKGESSYWIRRTPPGPPPETLRDQF